MNESAGFNISFMRKHWNSKAGSYDNNRDLSAPDSEILRIIEAEKPEQLLEIGFGPGIFASELTRDFPVIIYHGVDISEEFIQKAKRKLEGNCFLTQADCRFLPYRNNSFDIVIEMDAIHHFPRQLQIYPICEISRVLRQGGLAVIAEDWSRTPENAREELAYKLQKQRFLNSSGLEYHPKDKEWQEMFEECGMRKISIKHVSRPLNMEHFEKLPEEAAQEQVKQMKTLWRGEKPTTYMSIIVFRKD